MTVAENIVRWYRERQAAISNVAEWTASNADKANVLHTAHRFAVEQKLIEG